MKSGISQKEALFFRTLLVFVLILVAAALRVAPHPWNFAPVGAMALFSGVMIRDRHLAFLFPVLTLLVGDAFLGFHKLTPIVYASFLFSVLIGRLLRHRRTIPRLAGVTLLGSAQFFVVTNFAVWQFMGSYPHNFAGLVACYVAGLPFFWNTLAGDAFYAGFLFGGFALAERLIPSLRHPGQAVSS